MSVVQRRLRHLGGGHDPQADRFWTERVFSYLWSAPSMTLPLADADVRPALRARVLKRHAKEPDTVLLDELGVCRGLVRVDLAVVNGLFHGFEIKSDRADSARSSMPSSNASVGKTWLHQRRS